MVERKRRDAWDHTSHILATLLNVNRGKRDKAVSAAQCNPFRVSEAKAARPKISDVKLLARMMGIPVDDGKAGA